MATKRPREPNDLLHAARSRMKSPTGSDRPMSRQELADAINRYMHEKTTGTRQKPPLIDAAFVGRYELGRHRWPAALVREGFCAVLGIDNPADIGFYINRSTSLRSDHHRLTLPEADETSPPSLKPGYPGDVPAAADVTRAGSVAVQADTGWAEMLRRTALTAPPAFVALHLLDAVRLRRPTKVADPETVNGLAAVAAHYRRAYHVVPATRLLPAAQAHLDIVMSLRPEWQPENAGKSLLTTAGEMAALAGVILGLDATRHLAALSYFDFGWDVARAADNVELQTVILGCRSFALANGGGDHAAARSVRISLARSAGTAPARRPEPGLRRWRPNGALPCVTWMAATRDLMSHAPRSPAWPRMASCGVASGGSTPPSCEPTRAAIGCACAATAMPRRSLMTHSPTLMTPCPATGRPP